jgi:hypothetical protein
VDGSVKLTVRRTAPVAGSGPLGVWQTLTHVAGMKVWPPVGEPTRAHRPVRPSRPYSGGNVVHRATGRGSRRQRSGHELASCAVRRERRTVTRASAISTPSDLPCDVRIPATKHALSSRSPSAACRTPTTITGLFWRAIGPTSRTESPGRSEYARRTANTPDRCLSCCCGADPTPARVFATSRPGTLGTMRAAVRQSAGNLDRALVREHGRSHARGVSSFSPIVTGPPGCAARAEHHGIQVAMERCSEPSGPRGTCLGLGRSASTGPPSSPRLRRQKCSRCQAWFLCPGAAAGPRTQWPTHRQR